MDSLSLFFIANDLGNIDNIHYDYIYTRFWLHKFLDKTTA